MIGHGFVHPNAGDPAHDVVEAFQVLDIDGGIDVDPGAQNLLHILPALSMPRSRHVGMREFIDQDQGGLSRDRCGNAELVKHFVAVDDSLWRQVLEAFRKRCSVPPAMRFQHPDDDVAALLELQLRRRQHRAGLSDSGGGAKEDLQLASRGKRLLFPDFLKDAFGVGPGLTHLPVIASRARFNAKTLTRGSPNSPHWRSSFRDCTRAVTFSSEMSRARATRPA